MTPGAKAGLLRRLSMVCGVSCAAIGTLHLALRSEGSPGLAGAGVSEDSQEASYNGIFFSYGVARIWVARQRPIRPEPIWCLAGAMALGGLGRVDAIRGRGFPHPFWTALTGVEFAAPALLAWLAAGAPGPPNAA